MHVYNHPQVDIIAEDHTVQCLHLFFLHAFTAFPPSRPSAEAAGVTWIPTFFGIFVGTYGNVGHTFDSVAPPFNGTNPGLWKDRRP